MEQVLGSSSEDVLKKPVRGGRSFTSEERRSIDLSSQIPGWGSDLENDKRPGVPFDKAPFIGIETLYPDTIEQQIPRIKILKSTEHARLTPVFGTSCPLRGVSGRIREYAYTLSEGLPPHWLLLLFADRVDALEGILSDLASLRIPIIPKEMGLKSELKYNPAGLAKKVAFVGLAVGGFMLAKRYRDARA